MKRQCFFFVTALTLISCCCTLARVGWFRADDGVPSRSASVRPPSCEEVADPFVSSSGLRWRQGLPTHWRACLLQR